METYNQMLWVNACSAAVSCLWLFGDASMGAAIAFIQRHPAALVDCFTLSLASTCGQLCILYTIREFGALLFATIMTTRQFLSILLSCLIFMHPLTWQQWLGTALVFASLYYQAFNKGARGGKSGEVGGGGGDGGDAKDPLAKEMHAEQRELFAGSNRA